VGSFINTFIAKFQLSTSVRELWKSVNRPIYQRYGQEYSVSFFDSPCILILGKFLSLTSRSKFVQTGEAVLGC